MKKSGTQFLANAEARKRCLWQCYIEVAEKEVHCSRAWVEGECDLRRTPHGGLGSQAASLGQGQNRGQILEQSPVLIRSVVRSPKKLRTRKQQTVVRSQVSRSSSSSTYTELEKGAGAKCWVFQMLIKEVRVFRSPARLSYCTFKKHHWLLHAAYLILSELHCVTWIDCYEGFKKGAVKSVPARVIQPEATAFSNKGSSGSIGAANEIPITNLGGSLAPLFLRMLDQKQHRKTTSIWPNSSWDGAYFSANFKCTPNSSPFVT